MYSQPQVIFTVNYIDCFWSGNVTFWALIFRYREKLAGYESLVEILETRDAVVIVDESVFG